MAEVVLFHHVQGLTDGVRAFAAALEEGGHTVHAPDLFDGEHPATIDEASPSCRPSSSTGSASLGARARAAAAGRLASEA